MYSSGNGNILLPVIKPKDESQNINNDKMKQKVVKIFFLRISINDEEIAYMMTYMVMDLQSS